MCFYVTLFNEVGDIIAIKGIIYITSVVPTFFLRVYLLAQFSLVLFGLFLYNENKS